MYVLKLLYTFEIIWGKNIKYIKLQAYELE
jgi:hypothetical protein